jgi:cell division protein FtsI (penicillin-binding protein 3)
MSDSIKHIMLRRLQLVFLGMVLLGGTILFRGTNLYYAEGESYRAKADSAYVHYRIIEAERGNIYAEDGSLLAASFPYFTVAIDPLASSEADFRSSVDSLSIFLARHNGVRSSGDYRRQLIQARAAGKRYIRFDNRVSYPELQEMKHWPLFRLGQYKGGMIVEAFNLREKPYGVLAHRTIGYVTDEVSVGIEGQYDELLKGQDGQQLVRKISGGYQLPLNDRHEIEPRNGRDIVTTLDISIQDVAEAALESSLVKHDAEYGSAVVMEVATGKIVAMANLTRLEEGVYFEKFNYAIGDRTEPGSTFKLASMLALFEDDLCGLDELVDLERGRCTYHGVPMVDSEGKHDLTEVTLARAFWRSSNVGISKLINRYYRDKPEKFVDKLKQFHLNEVTGVRISGEEPPIMPTNPSDRNNWSGITLPWLSIGYELQISPLQTLTFYNAVANGGKMMQPYLVSDIQEHGKTIEHFDPVVLDQHIASPKSIAMVQELLRMVVDSGTARKLRSPYYQVAGKTGTTVINNERVSYRENIYQASFAGYFPADEPRYSCVVVISAPRRNGYYGADVAGPVFKAIADRVYASHLGGHDPVNGQDKPRYAPAAKGYEPDLREVYNDMGWPIEWSESSEWVAMKSTPLEYGSQAVCNPLDVFESNLPDVRGMGLRDALFLLENKGWQVTFSGMGKVRAVRKDDSGTLHLSLG